MPKVGHLILLSAGLDIVWEISVMMALRRETTVGINLQRMDSVAVMACREQAYRIGNPSCHLCS